MSTSTGFDSQSTADDVTAGLDLRGSTWLITGCNSGLGYESARVLGARGARIIGLARTRAKAADALGALGLEGDPVACDLGDLASVRAAAATVRDLAPLDGLMANAGIMALPALEQIGGIERQFATNHLGHFALVQHLVDRLTDTGRVVLLSSGAHRLASRGLEIDNLSGEDDYDAWRMYGRSKLANILHARSLAQRFAGTRRTANAVHPGVIETNLGRHVADREAMYARFKPILKSIGQGAATQCYVAVRPEVDQISGAYFDNCAVAETLPAGRDDTLAERLWQRSEALTGAAG